MIYFTVVDNPDQSAMITDFIASSTRTKKGSEPPSETYNVRLLLSIIDQIIRITTAREIKKERRHRYH